MLGNCYALDLCNPVYDESISCGFGCYSGHKGSDFAAAMGTPIYFPTDSGLVTLVDIVDGQTCSLSFGTRVEVTIGNSNFKIIFAHMDPSVEVEVGQVVKKGELLGYVSNSGYTLTFVGGQWLCESGGGYHLHLEMRENNIAFDIENYPGVNFEDISCLTDSNPLEGDSSCLGHCGESTGNGSCYCDSVCESYNDCCEDFAIECNPSEDVMIDSCLGHCGEASNTGSCYCDSVCESYNDCCEDFTIECL